jgi:hypothetical protein
MVVKYIWFTLVNSKKHIAPASGGGNMLFGSGTGPLRKASVNFAPIVI